MLTNLLPGIRDLRTPLATGYLWLLALWLWIPSHFKYVPPTSGIPGDITRLTHYAGRAGVAIAISFAAYLIGVLSKSLNPPLVRLGTASTYIAALISGSILPKFQLVDFWRRAFPIDTPRDQFAGSGFLASKKSFSIDAISIATGRLSEAGIYSLQESSRRAADEGVIDKEMQARYYSYLLTEVPGLGNALVGKETELYSVYDRLISEYEFRIGVGAPLIALIVTLAIRWSLLWLLVLLPVLALLAAGSEQRMAAGDLLADAVRLKRIDIALPQELAPTGTNLDDFGFETKTLGSNVDQTRTKRQTG
jgi:hypothetical protein